jgi:hypothetical protein
VTLFLIAVFDIGCGLVVVARFTQPSAMLYFNPRSRFLHSFVRRNTSNLGNEQRYNGWCLLAHEARHSNIAFYIKSSLPSSVFSVVAMQKRHYIMHRLNYSTSFVTEDTKQYKPGP